MLSGYRFTFNGKETDNEVYGKGNCIAYELRIYDPRVGRFNSIDPRQREYPWQSTYAYYANSPIGIVDFKGGGKTGDYYGTDGKKLGTDGNADGKIYVVDDKKDIKKIKDNDKKGGVTPLAEVQSATELPSANVRKQMGAAVDRSNAPNTNSPAPFTGDDDEGGFHEEGGLYGTDANGQPAVREGAPGNKADPSKVNRATMTPAYPADASSPVLTNVQGSYHVHPSGSRMTFGTNGSTIRDFSEYPTNPEDYSEASKYSGNCYVLSPRTNRVIIYNGSGTITSFPLNKFRSLGN